MELKKKSCSGGLHTLFDIPNLGFFMGKHFDRMDVGIAVNNPAIQGRSCR
jgi:hypothetical protein